MRKPIWYVLVLALVLVLAAGCTAAAPASAPVAGTETGTAGATEQAAATGTGASPITVRLAHRVGTEHARPQPGPRLFLHHARRTDVPGSDQPQQRDGPTEPELAESWTVSDDGLTWTFNMRKDAVWSDGKPVTAKDVEYSVKRAVKPETASPYAYVLYLIKNAAAINQTAVPTDTYDIDSLGVKALDDYTVEFTLEAPAPYFESISSIWTMRPVPSWAIEKYGDAWTDPANIVVNGPYTTHGVEAGREAGLRKEPHLLQRRQGADRSLRS